MQKILLPLLILLLLSSSYADSKPTNSIESFFRPSRARKMSMSPDGKYVAALAPIGKKGDSGIILIDLETMKTSGSKWGNGYDVYSYAWASNDTILFNVSKWNTYSAGLFRLERKKSTVEQIIKNDAVARVVHPMTDNEKYSWVWVPSVAEGKPFLAQLDVKGNSRTSTLNDATSDTLTSNLLSRHIRAPRGNVYRWVFDQDQTPKLVLRFFDGKLEYVKQEGKDDWTALKIDPEKWKVISLLSDENTAYVEGYNGEKTTGLYTYNLDTNEPVDLIYRDDYYDYSASVSYKYYKKQLIGIAYDRAVPVTRWFVPEFEGLQSVVDGTIKGKSNVLIDWSDDLSKILIASYSDKDPSEYIFLDLENKILKQITETKPWLDKSQLCSTQVLHYKTKDGLKLEGYLTLPKTGPKPYPTVVLAHGGPWVRDTGGYDNETQFLASRGYAVLKVNYRGSSGYGYEISENASYQFLNMHNDVTHAVKLMIKSELADPERIAIMGGSFGGYLALCGAAFEPELYKCAISVVGVFDWELAIKTDKQNENDYRRHTLLEKLGDPKETRDHFEEISPINHVDKIQIPIFIAHGKNDTNVSVLQSKKLRNKLKERGIPHETYFREWEGHGFVDDGNRLEFYKRIESFLDANL